MVKEKYKVLIFVESYPGSLKTIDNNSYYAKTVDIWNYIKKHLNNKYDFEEHFTFKRDYNKAVEDCHKGKYDIVAASIGINYKYYQKVNFTFPLYVVTPNLYYDVSSINIDYYNYLKHFFSLLLKPYFVLIISGLLLGYLYNKIIKKKSFYSSYHILSGFFGQKALTVKSESFLFTIPKVHT